MSEMIERVARAIYPTIAHASDSYGMGFPSWNEAATDNSWLIDSAIDAARAAIEAMREPTAARNGAP